MPPRFTPFSQSLANRGMKQTNNSIGNMNQPPNMNQGGGNVMGGQMGSGMIGVGEEGSGSGMDTGDLAGIYGDEHWYNVYQIGGGPGSNISWQGSLGGDAYDDYLAEQEIINSMPDDILPEGYEWIWSGSDWIPSLINTNYGNVVTPPSYLQENPNDPNVIADNQYSFPDYSDSPQMSPYEELIKFGEDEFDLNQDGTVDIFDMQLIDPNTMTPQEYEQFYAAMQNYIQGDIAGGYDSSVFEQAFPTGQAQQFAGGGGQGGQAARKLYYPGTSGGFAGVGSGIGGGSTLQDLLKGLG